MATTYAPNGDTITTTYDGGDADGTDYLVTVNDAYAGRITLYDGGSVHATPPNGAIQRFGNARAALHYLAAYAAA